MAGRGASCPPTLVKKEKIMAEWLKRNKKYASSSEARY